MAETDNHILYSSGEQQKAASFEHSTYQVVSEVAFLIGVTKRSFENEHDPPQL